MSEVQKQGLGVVIGCGSKILLKVFVDCPFLRKCLDEVGGLKFRRQACKVQRGASTCCSVQAQVQRRWVVKEHRVQVQPDLPEQDVDVDELTRRPPALRVPSGWRPDPELRQQVLIGCRPLPL